MRFKESVWLAALLWVAGCASNQSTSTYRDDPAVSSKVKTALGADPLVNARGIEVRTFHGKVQLSGFVDTSEQKVKASKDAQRVPGVRRVKNDLIVRTQAPIVPMEAGAELRSSPVIIAPGTNAPAGALPQSQEPAGPARP